MKGLAVLSLVSCACVRFFCGRTIDCESFNTVRCVVKSRFTFVGFGCFGCAFRVSDRSDRSVLSSKFGEVSVDGPVGLTKCDSVGGKSFVESRFTFVGFGSASRVSDRSLALVGFRFCDAGLTERNLSGNAGFGALRS